MSCEAELLQDLCVACGIFSPVALVKSACLESCTLCLAVSVPVSLPCLQGLPKVLLRDQLLAALHSCRGALQLFSDSAWRILQRKEIKRHGWLKIHNPSFQMPTMLF